MSIANPIDLLNRLVVLHGRSLAVYLHDASPTWHRGDERARDVLRQIAADHLATMERLGRLIVELDGPVQFGGFPMTFTSYHDLDFQFLLERLLQEQARNLAVLEQCAGPLARVPRAQALVLEALGAARAHRDLLEGLRRNGPSLPEVSASQGGLAAAAE